MTPGDKRQSLALSLLACLISIYAASSCADSNSPLPSGLSANEACARMADVRIPAADIGLATSGATITTASLVSASDKGNPNGDYCLVLGAIHPTTNDGSDIHFEVNLPTQWNSKSVQFGGSGFNGVLVTGLGFYAKQPESEETLLARGYATFGSDSGHHSDALFDGRFLLSDEALNNYGHQQVKKNYDVALQLIRSHYQSEPELVYFVGGSQGGHEAFDAAQRYPEDYDGVIAGYPAHNLVMLHLSANRYAAALHGNGGQNWISPIEISAFVKSVYTTCDPLDGADDGIISNVTACRDATAGFKLFGPENPIRCNGENRGENNCLSDTQIQALIVMDTPFDLGFSIFPDDKGNSRFPKWTPFEGSTFFDGGFPNLGSEGPGQALQFLPGEATPRYAIARDPTLDTMSNFDPADWVNRITELAPQISANSVNLDAFQEKGGKLIVFHGLVDDFITPYSSIEYYSRLLTRYGGNDLDKFVRFYTIPGMGHRGGPFRARISTVDYLEAWVEHGEPPEELLATDTNDATAGRTRPVCRYPEWPQYMGSGSLNEADSFRCIDP